MSITKGYYPFGTTYTYKNECSQIKRRPDIERMERNLF